MTTTNRTFATWGLIVLATLGLFAPESHAQIPNRVADRPPSNGPLQVKTGLYYVDISEIDGATETFSATAYLVFVWNDPRMKFQPDGGSYVKLYKPDDIWTPSAEIVNAETVTDQEPPLCTVTMDGTVYYARRVVMKLNNQMDLRRFPFDQQGLKVIIESSSRYGADELVFTPDPVQSGVGDDIVSIGWSYAPLTWKVVKEPYAHTGATYSRLIFTFEAKRNAAYYVWKIVLPVTVFVLLTWSIFFIEVHDVQTALIISITVLLTAVAFGDASDSALPKVGYRTWIDQFEVGSFLFIVATVVEAITVYCLNRSGDNLRAVKVRTAFRFIYPISYALFCGALLLMLFI